MHDNTIKSDSTELIHEVKSNHHKKKSFYLSLLLFVLLLVSISINIYFYYEIRSYTNEIESLRHSLLKLESKTDIKSKETSLNKTQNTAVEVPSPKPPTKNSIDSEFQTVTIETPKYLDNPEKKEYYKIVFEKVSPNSMYSLTNDLFQHLIIFDDSYEFSLNIPKEGYLNVFKTIPSMEKISTNQFQDIYRITNPVIYMDNETNDYEKGMTYFSYTSDYSEDCSQYSPKPAACSLMQVEFSNPSSTFGKTHFYASCKVTSSEAVKLCDRIISSLQINQL